VARIHIGDGTIPQPLLISPITQQKCAKLRQKYVANLTFSACNLQKYLTSSLHPSSFCVSKLERGAEARNAGAPREGIWGGCGAPLQFGGPRKFVKFYMQICTFWCFLQFLASFRLSRPTMPGKNFGGTKRYSCLGIYIGWGQTPPSPGSDNGINW